MAFAWRKMEDTTARIALTRGNVRDSNWCLLEGCIFYCSKQKEVWVNHRKYIRFSVSKPVAKSVFRRQVFSILTRSSYLLTVGLMLNWFFSVIISQISSRIVFRVPLLCHSLTSLPHQHKRRPQEWVRERQSALARLNEFQLRLP